MFWQRETNYYTNGNSLADLYKQKLVTAEEAVQCIAPGDDVVVPFGAAESPALIEAMSRRWRELEDVKVHQMHPMHFATYLKPEFKDHFQHVSWFTTAVNRPAVLERRADYMPAHFSDYPDLFTNLGVDVFMGTVSPMDRHGFFSFGISVDYNTTAASLANKVILAVNPNMPKTMGQSFIHISQVDYIVEDKAPLAEIEIPQVNEKDEAIASYIAEYIDDGATLQLGIGSIPNAITKYLFEKRDLGIHTEMISDGMVDLVLQGSVTNTKKTLHRGKIIGCFALGSKRLYDFLHDNPMVEMYPVSYTNDPRVIALNDNMISINATLGIDLLGQCASESIGPTHYSGTGGQVDFARGALASRGGKGFLVTYSTTTCGKTKIMPRLPEGTVVTTSKNDVDHIVTEYGVAKLRGKTAKQRALALISIAHPNFRADLTKQARQLNII